MTRLFRPACVAVVLVAVAACSSTGASSTATSTITLTVYTSVTQDTVDAVLAVVAQKRPDLQIDVFRAPTGELDARIATERRSGGVQADVLWATDPLSTEQYAADGLLAPLTSEAVNAIAPEYRSDTFVGTRLLNLVVVGSASLESQPTSWQSLADPAFAGEVVIPDPGFAGSAFAALGYFAAADGYGMDFYSRLKANGAVQLASIGDVVTDVAEGRHKVGISLDKSVRDAVTKGSPIVLDWPEPGAIAIYSPVAIFASSRNTAGASDFVDLLLSPEVQAAIAATGWQPIRPDVEWPYDGPTVTVDWNDVFGRQDELLGDYRAIFGE